MAKPNWIHIYCPWVYGVYCFQWINFSLLFLLFPPSLFFLYFFLFFSFFLLILSSGFITRQLIEKVDMREGTLSVCGLFSFCASKQTIHLYLPCPVPWEAGLYGKLLVVSLALWFPGFNLREAPAGGERAEWESGTFSFGWSLSGCSLSVDYIPPSVKGHGSYQVTLSPWL